MGTKTSANDNDFALDILLNDKTNGASKMWPNACTFALYIFKFCRNFHIKIKEYIESFPKNKEWYLK